MSLPHGLKSLIAPTSVKSHCKMDPSDKLIWDAAYDEEYDGLVSLPTWEVISEAQFRQTFFSHVFVQTSFRQLFLLHVRRKSCQNDIRTKNSYVKPLMKLTTGVEQSVITRPSRVFIPNGIAQ